MLPRYAITADAIRPDVSNILADLKGITTIGALCVENLSNTPPDPTMVAKTGSPMGIQDGFYSFCGLLVCVVGSSVERITEDRTRERNTGDVTISHPDDFSVSHDVLESKLGNAESLQREVGCPFAVSVLRNKI